MPFQDTGGGQRNNFLVGDIDQLERGIGINLSSLTFRRLEHEYPIPYESRQGLIYHYQVDEADGWNYDSYRESLLQEQALDLDERLGNSSIQKVHTAFKRAGLQQDKHYTHYKCVNRKRGFSQRKHTIVRHSCAFLLFNRRKNLHIVT